LEAREAAGLSREDLIAMLAGAGHSLAHQTMMRWELAHRDVPAWYLRALADVLGTDPSWLLGSESSPAYARLAALRAVLQEAVELLDAPLVSPSAGGVSLEDAERAVGASKGTPPDRRRKASGADGAGT